MYNKSATSLIRKIYTKYQHNIRIRINVIYLKLCVMEEDEVCQ